MPESVTITSITTAENGNIHVEYSDKSGETFLGTSELEGLANDLLQAPRVNHLAVAILFRNQPELFNSPPGDLGDDAFTITVDLSADNIVEVPDA